MKKIARIYCRVSTVQQDSSRQMALREWAEQRGYKEKLPENTDGNLYR